jgi:5'-nucleotidase
MDKKPDVVISGINYGYNAGTDIQYSGTLGAALEGAFQGIHAIAFSESADPCHETADNYLADMLAEALNVKLGYGQVVNINFPHGPLSECKGVLRDRSISRGMFFSDTYKKISDKDNGTSEYMVDGKWTAIGEEGSDIKAIMDGYVSVGIVSNIQ